MTEYRILLALALLFGALLGYGIAKSETSANAHGCRASGGTWHIPQQSCTWDQR